MAPDGAHVHGHGGGGPGPFSALMLFLALAFAAMIAGPVIAAVTVLVHVVLIIAAALVATAVAAGAGLLAWHLRRHRAGRRPSVPLLTPRPLRGTQPLSEPREPRPALERPAELHLHLHGVTPADIAAMLNGVQPDTTTWRATSAAPHEDD